MSFVRLGLQAIGNASRAGLQKVILVRSISQSYVRNQQEQLEQEEQQAEGGTEEESSTQRNIDPRSDRSQIIPVSTSIKYLQSDAYKITYGDDPVWKMYRRNFKGTKPPRKTRKTCIRDQALATSNPCPICRDEYLVLHHENVELIKQFISPHNGEIISYTKTGLCQRQHNNLLIAMINAKEYGTVTFDVPFREYDYSEWYQPESESKNKEEE